MTTTIIKVLVNDQVCGVIQSIIRGVDDPNLQCKLFKISRVRLDKNKLPELFSRGFVNTMAQKIPFQIIIEEDNIEIGRIENAWFSTNEDMKIFTSGDWIISENVNIEAQDSSGALL